jgi:hypothetical protein
MIFSFSKGNLTTSSLIAGTTNLFNRAAFGLFFSLHFKNTKSMKRNSKTVAAVSCTNCPFKNICTLKSHYNDGEISKSLCGAFKQHYWNVGGLAKHEIILLVADGESQIIGETAAERLWTMPYN